MITLESAQEKVLRAIDPLEAERVPLLDSLGRIASQDVTARIPLPVFDNSMMDGYAVRSDDLRLASQHNPIRLKVAGSLPAGTTPDSSLEAGQCVRIFTGSPMPPRSDAVVMQEDVVKLTDHEVQFQESVKPWEHVRIRGEDVAEGMRICGRGGRIHSGNVALMAAVGIEAIEAYRIPLVGLIATGSELREPGNPLQPGEIYESNRPLIASLLRSIPAQPRFFPIVRDDLQAHCRLFTEALESCDVVVTTGGVSVGDHDYVKQAFESIGGTILTWKIAVKPGKPFVFGQWKHKLFFGLPGNPVSSLVSFLFLVRPALLRLQGVQDVGLKLMKGQLAEKVCNDGNRRHFMRVAVSPDGLVSTRGLQASHGLSSLLNSNGLIDVPPETEWKIGDKVEVYLWQDLGS